MNESKPVNQIDEFRATLNSMENQIKMALPEHVTPERFIRVVMTAIQTNPVVLQADRRTLLSACMKSAQDGLLPDGKQAALVTYNLKNGDTVAQYMPMVQGILKLVRNSGDLSTITSQIVHKNDSFKYWVNDQGEHIDHTPLMFGERGPTIGVYALAKTKDGGVYIEVMTREQINAVRAVSRAKNGPWAGPFEHEMWRKTAIRRLSKRLPMSTDLERVLSRDDDMFEMQNAQESLPDKAKQLDALISKPVTETLPEPKPELSEIDLEKALNAPQRMLSGRDVGSD